ncbi:Pre-rRNA-processing protein TSR2-like [Oopsacas minuta]|uniref:Pre-rRNA-processing protein TSR2 homolog n=1 Tax=Oopsacas minuta TaxID=111878 RepID=A0AAV7JQJ5_9METZ|nr:Pre-rRNA-processing protein TSR2-like [Oopsacas minuta]
MAVENSFGGPDTKEKAEWLKEVVVDYILSKKLLDIDELEEYILNIMETEFNTLVDDGSCIKLCETILRVYTAIQLNDTLEIEQILSPFRLLVKSNVKTAKPVKESVIHEDTDEKTEICIVTQSERETTVLNTDFTDKCDDDMDVSGEWQIVTRSKKKKKKVSTSIMNI